MSTASNQPAQPAPNRRRIVAVVAIVIIVLVALGLVAGWLFFFGSEAPDAPTLDDALKVLQPSADPE